MMSWSYPPETPVLILLFHREEEGALPISSFQTAPLPTNPLCQLQEGANHTPTMPRRNPPQTPVLILLLHPEEEGAVPLKPHRYPPTSCASWRRELVICQPYCIANHLRRPFLLCCFTWKGRELFPSKCAATHQPAAPAGGRGSSSYANHTPHPGQGWNWDILRGPKLSSTAHASKNIETNSLIPMV